jgi:hypothetical protein
MLKGGQTPAAIESEPVARRRIEAIKKELQKWASAKVEFDFDPSGTDLFSILELAYGYAKRAQDLSRSIEALLAQGHIVSAAIVGRALIETVAMGTFFIAEMDRLIVHADVQKLKKRLMSFWGGSKLVDVKPVHVNDALRHFEKVDAAYVRYLDEKYGAFTAMVKAMQKTGKEVASVDEALSAMKSYDFLSEISHPNGVGVQFIYPELDGIEDRTRAAADTLLDQYRSKALIAIFQCHHLIKALETTKKLPERYRKSFMSSQRSR